jgi:hypothetical protein
MLIRIILLNNKLKIIIVVNSFRRLTVEIKSKSARGALYILSLNLTYL